MGRLAIDIGGTFTDLAYYEPATGRLVTDKTLTTPDDLVRGVLDAVRLAEVDPAGVDRFVHGGTTVINALTERKGAVTALVTTEGFRDVLAIARGNRPDLYNFLFRKPEPFVPRRLRFEVRERLDASGIVLEALDPDSVAAVAEACRAAGVEAVAIQLLHSWRNPDHERRVAEALAAALPGVAITASHTLTREWREYERANTAALNAYVQPIVDRYLRRLEQGLDGAGIRSPRLAMQSNGGTTSFALARKHPITLVESGPAGGAFAAVHVGRAIGLDDLIYLDIGGTTAKCTLVQGGEVPVTTAYSIERTRQNPGYPIRVPVIDIVEIGAGGGSIAHLDGAGRLQVGPQSAGAAPGPACYGRGGSDATVTDAMLLTGVLDPAFFAAGRLDLDMTAAEDAMRRIGEPLHLTPVEAAVAVIRIAEASMGNALRLVSIQRGHDPRDFALVVGGGGGAMHGARLGRELGVREIVVPRFPGYFSAFGMLVTEPRRDLVRTEPMPAERADMTAVRALFDELAAEARAYMADLALPATLRFACRIDLRYRGQEHWVTVPVDPARSDMAMIVDAFHEAHRRSFGFRLDGTPVELVSYHLTATAPEPAPVVRAPAATGPAVLPGRRRVRFAEEGWHEAGVWRRDDLPPGTVIAGPAIVEEASSTTVLLPGQVLRVDEAGNLRLREA